MKHRRQRWPPRPPVARRFVLVWIPATTILFALCALWAFASPIPSGPDEAAQMLKSAGIVDGTFIGHQAPGRGPGTVDVKAPKVFDSVIHRQHCTYDIYISGNCSPAISHDATLAVYATYIGRYPPLYYLLTRLPFLVSVGPSTFYAMRLIDGLIVALLAGAACAALVVWGRSRLALLGLATVLTPTVFYLGGVVNSSSMEIAAGILFWVALALLAFERYDDPPLGLVVTAVAGGAVLCASRPISTLFYGLIVISFVVLRPRELWRVWKFRRIRWSAVVSVALALVSGVYVLVAKSYKIEARPIRGHRTTAFYVGVIFGRARGWTIQTIGGFGAPNFNLPFLLVIIWMVVIFGFLVAAITFTSRRDAVKISAIFVFLGAVLPFGIIYSHVHTNGPVWKGRYGMPLLVGLPIVCAAVLSSRFPAQVRALSGRVSWVAYSALSFGEVGAFYWFLRRYTIGVKARTIDPFKPIHGYWRPPIPAAVLFVCYLVVTLLWRAWLLRQGRVSSDTLGDRALTL